MKIIQLTKINIRNNRQIFRMKLRKDKVSQFLEGFNTGVTGVYRKEVDETNIVVLN